MERPFTSTVCYIMLGEIQGKNVGSKKRIQLGTISFSELIQLLPVVNATTISASVDGLISQYRAASLFEMR
jgi:hypothetical protein